MQDQCSLDYYIRKGSPIVDGKDYVENLIEYLDR